MKCKKCKYLLREKDYEYFIVHRWEAHGANPDTTRTLLVELGFTDVLNEELIKEAIKNHRRTGEAGKGMFKQ